jgi:exo-beta-1,3-glucanase (GH17 family)/cellulose synthase/poly-beta-1,6-N-acetylglucosamine synthase-like glycosyltransferase
MILTTLFRRHVLFVLALVMMTNIGFWSALNRSVPERPWGGLIGGVSFSPYGPKDDPEAGLYPSVSMIERSLDAVAPYVRSVRTYDSLNGLEKIAPLAAKRNLAVTQGAWIGKDMAANEAQIASLVRLVADNPNIRRVIVGNEAVLRGDVTVAEMVQILAKVRRQISVPVSTAEPWHVWQEHPELQDVTDYMAVHILPYWEGIPLSGALDYVLMRHDELAAKYPGKHIFLAEVGWPSEGAWVKGAEPSLVGQASFVRNFLTTAKERGFDYSVIEAFDQPWKRKIEGSVGAHWGLWDKDRQIKFPMSGEVRETTSWPTLCGMSLLLALLPILWFLRRKPDLRLGGKIFFAGLIQSAATIVVWSCFTASMAGAISSTGFAWILLIGAQGLLLLVLLIDGYELAEVVWSGKMRRAFKPLDDQPLTYAPKVSIHVPCYNEPADMVIDTMNALAALDYPDFEVLIIDNNTRDEAVWKPLEDHCAKLGPRFRFFHLPKWPGYKAGALNFALSQTAPDAEVVGVIDSDYQVTPNWLRATLPYFNSEKVGFVQGPQDYRDWDGDTFKTMCNWEYAGFFHIGMIQRNERNAIIQHGTMTLIRRTVLEGVGGWGEWCICEDAELGLRLFERGYEAVYMSDSFGKGLVPDSFSGYKTQRFRWAYGAIQILKRHAGELMPSWLAFLLTGKRPENQLTFGQRYHFIAGWLPWLADAAHMVFALAAIFWSCLLLLRWVEFPPAVFLVPTLSVFVFKILGGFWLYETRVKCSFPNKVGAAVAGMALTHAVGRAVWQGLFTNSKPFLRTPKNEDRPAAMQGLLMALEEVGLLLGLWGGALSVMYLFTTANHEAVIWSVMLMVQSLPYIAALTLSMINVWPALRKSFSKS